MENEFKNSLGDLNPRSSIEKSVIPKLSVPIQADAKAGKLATREMKYYMRKVVSGTAVEFDFKSLAAAEGLTNLENGKLPSGSSGVIKRITARYYTSAEINIYTGKYAPIASTDDPALVNAELEIKVGDETICKNPMNNFNHSPNMTDQAASLADGFNLSSHEPYKGGESITAMLRCPAALQNSTNAVLEIAVIVEELKKKRSI